MQHLWEVSHPYYCTTGNYCHEQCHVDYKSWHDFMECEGESDFDLNLIYRWDWTEDFDDDDDVEPFNGDPNYRNGELILFYMCQRKALARSVSISVCRNDEESVRNFLEPRWKHMIELWEGLS